MSQLTFGVELEFALPMLKWYDTDPHPHDPRKARGWDVDDEAEWGYQPKSNMLRIIANTLLHEGIPAVSMANTDLSSVDVDVLNADQWKVTLDGSVKDKADYVEWYGIEVISPVMQFCEESFKMVRSVCEIILKNFRTKNTYSSGLHVHIGRGRLGLQLGTMKKLLAFIWAFQPQIDALHTRHDTYWAQDIRTQSLLGEEVRMHSIISPLEPKSDILFGLKKIFGSNSFEELFSPFAKLLDPLAWPAYGRMSYAFYQLSTREDNKIKRTVEFRQAAGTLDADFILAWIETVAGFVEMALADSNEEALLNLLLEAVRRELDHEEQPDILDLLEVLGIKKPAAYFRKTKNQRDALRKAWLTSSFDWHEGGGRHTAGRRPT